MIDILVHHQMAVYVCIFDILAIFRTLLAKPALLSSTKSTVLLYSEEYDPIKRVGTTLAETSYLICN
jgi:hypothetical protein